MMQKCIGGYFDNHQGTLPVNTDFFNTTKRASRLAAGGTKRRKIIFPQQTLSGAVHQTFIERFFTPRHQAAKNGWGNGFIANDVAISTRERRKSGMSQPVYPGEPVKPNVSRQAGIGTPYPVVGLPLGGCIEMNNLIGCVNACICAPRTGDGNGLIGDKTQRLLHRRLNTGAVALPLPTTKMTAVVFNGGSHAQYPLGEFPPFWQQAIAQIYPGLIGQNATIDWLIDTHSAYFFKQFPGFCFLVVTSALGDFH